MEERMKKNENHRSVVVEVMMMMTMFELKEIQYFQNNIDDNCKANERQRITVMWKICEIDATRMAQMLHFNLISIRLRIWKFSSERYLFGLSCFVSQERGNIYIKHARTRTQSNLNKIEVINYHNGILVQMHIHIYIFKLTMWNLVRSDIDFSFISTCIVLSAFLFLLPETVCVRARGREWALRGEIWIFCSVYHE